jgi:bisphosphoglycerate-dependent phosphoglycerate mutase
MEHHICIQENYLTFDGDTIPFGKKDIEEHFTKVLPDIFDMIIHKIKDKNKIIICGEGESKRILGRKLEDRLGRGINYE